MELIQQMALVSEVSEISDSQLSRASAALQKQLTRDFGPVWGLNATIDAFARLPRSHGRSGPDLAACGRPRLSPSA